MQDQFKQIANRLAGLEGNVGRLMAQDRPLQLYDPAFPAVASFIKDDFIVNATGFGELGWNNTGSNSWGSASVTDVAGRPGVVQKSTGATINSISYMSLRGSTSSSFQPMNGSMNFDLTWMVRLNTNDAATLAQLGLNSNPATGVPVDGIYIEKLAADTSWFGVTRAASTQTRTAALATVTTNFVKFRLRRLDANTIGFTVDNGAEVTATTNVPTAALHPFLLIFNSAAANKTVDIDYFHLLITGLSR